jgi:BirA family biotin operon repressor/biotin-[acetyl-CoA-carboxylase] ligase
MWGEVIRYAEATSTNELARDHARRGAGEGTAIVAAFQARGRGRRGRVWEAPPGKALLVSFVLRPPAYAAHSAWLTLAGGVAAARAVRDLTGRDARLKWPNDVLFEGKKVGGVLAESYRVAETVCILGLGLNANQSLEEMTGELAETATSLLIATGGEWSVEALLDGVTGHLQELYGHLVRGDNEAVRAAWRELDNTVGRLVEVDSPEGRWSGRATDIDEYGALVVEQEDVARRVTVGDVTVRFAE